MKKSGCSYIIYDFWCVRFCDYGSSAYRWVLHPAQSVTLALHKKIDWLYPIHQSTIDGTLSLSLSFSITWHLNLNLNKCYYYLEIRSKLMSMIWKICFAFAAPSSNKRRNTMRPSMMNTEVLSNDGLNLWGHSEQLCSRSCNKLTRTYFIQIAQMHHANLHWLIFLCPEVLLIYRKYRSCCREKIKSKNLFFKISVFTHAPITSNK